MALNDARSYPNVGISFSFWLRRLRVVYAFFRYDKRIRGKNRFFLFSLPTGNARPSYVENNVAITGEGLRTFSVYEFFV